MIRRPQFSMTATADFTELRLMAAGLPIPTAHWPLSGHPGADICQRWIVDEDAIEDDEVLFVLHVAVSRLSAGQAARLDLPEATQFRAVVDGSGGAMIQPGFEVSLRWVRPSGQNVLGVKRVGAWLDCTGVWSRLPETLFAVAEAVDSHRAAGSDEAGRLRALAALRRALPQAANAQAHGLLGMVTIIEADAFSLETAGEGDAMQLVPVLHRAGASADSTPLLPEDRQRKFGVELFYKSPSARPVYSLPGGVYVTISPTLRQALEVVRRMAKASPAERRSFLREPRAAINTAIGDEADTAFIATLLIETSVWSERVIGLGLWQKRVIPWVALAANDWLGAGQVPARGVMVGDRTLPLTGAEGAELLARIEAALASGEATVTVPAPDGPLEVPATAETVLALKSVMAEPKSRTPTGSGGSDEKLGILIKPNEQQQDMEALVRGRAAPVLAVPSCLLTKLKAHQQVGLTWLQQNWLVGSPGVLLADDMGLGKTLQGLAFLAWLREGMRAGTVTRRPVLIVAPAGLLQNWLAEHDKHLDPPGLGNVLQAFGKGLAALRTGGAGGRLDIPSIRQADWVLTTYETLRDQDQDFGQVEFAAMLIDEAQKVKTPGIRMTDAIKGMHADFRIAMTGTPVENRLADLWCIVDGVAPGHLNSLRYFSDKFEAAVDIGRLTELRASLDQPQGPRPALLLRRLKEDELPDLPKLTECITEQAMTGVQLSAYQDALAMGRNDRAAGRVLEALQRLRKVSLHPDHIYDDNDDAFVAKSVRLRLVLRTLDEIAAKGDRVLLFVEELACMARLTGLLQRRYRLASPPLTINGSVSGAARHARVERFQHGPRNFDVMLMSPKAGGVGLTLTRANHVIHLTRWWNPAVEDQCTARALRIGQDKPVTVHIPVTTLPDGKPSFDQRLHALLARKRQLMRDALLPSQAHPEELSTMLEQIVG